VKRLNSTNEQDFFSEVKMLKDFSKHKHPHLVRLLATYHFKNAYYLLFPYAKYNLRKYWEATSLPKFDEATLSWSLHQCKAIASGLHLIHEQHKTQDIEVGLPDEDRTFGRHGDIKPENILWSIEVDKRHEKCCFPEQGFLLIADFGLTAVHKRLTRSRVLAENIGGSQTYEPPEIRLKKQVSRGYDIWSLGCLYLEFITWIMLGQDGLGRFLEARSKTDDSVISEDSFYTIINYAPGISEPKAVVRESVREWIKDLHEHQRCSDFIHDFLDVVDNHMLVVSLSGRISCVGLNDRLREMVGRGKTSPAYLTQCKPKPQRSKAPKGPTVHWRLDSDNESSPGNGFQLPRRGMTN
jgi:serine/threonine protein kinase